MPIPISLAAAVVTARPRGALRLARRLAAVPPPRWRELVLLSKMVAAVTGFGPALPVPLPVA
jgi:hypothetical protein